VGWSPEGWKGETTSNSGMTQRGYLRGVTDQAGPEPVNTNETPMAQMAWVSRGTSSGRLIQNTSGIRGA
jgi:hypothetical protein